MANYQSELPPPGRSATKYSSPEAMRNALGERRTVTVDVREFVRTRDALTSAYMNLSQSIDHAVKAYLNHTQTIINGDGALNASLLTGPFNEITQTAQQVALQALSAQGNGSIDPQLLQNGQTGKATENGEGDGDGKKKRKKRAYKKRDPDAPKRPLTAYFRYLGEVRPKIMEEVKANPGKFEEAGKPGDISKIATKRWNLLTAEQQEPYKKAYRDGLQDYEEEVKKYKLKTGQEVDDSKVDPDATEMGPDGDAEGGGEEEEEEDEEEDEDDQPQQVQNKASAAGKDDDSDDSTSSESDAEGESDEEVPAKAAPQPKKTAPTPKSAMKKGGKQAQTFSSVPEPPAKEASPAKKRKAAAEPEESTKSSKKKSRKSTVTAGADPAPSPAPAAAESSPPATEKSSKKSKKDKKKRRSSVEA